jgi:hypothetical protein
MIFTDPSRDMPLVRLVLVIKRSGEFHCSMHRETIQIWEREESTLLKYIYRQLEQTVVSAREWPVQSAVRVVVNVDECLQRRV